MKKTITLNQVRCGEHFMLGGIEFVKLDDDKGASFVVAADITGKECPFESSNAKRDDHNNFVGSHIQKVVEAFLLDHPEINKAVVDRPIDLTSMDGMTDYGYPVVHGRILTSDEYRKYRAFIPLASDWYWLATPWTTLRSPRSGSYGGAYLVNSSGAQSSDYVSYAGYCPRPALYLESSISVSVETDDEKSLRDYTDAELLDELLRRRTVKEGTLNV